MIHLYKTNVFNVHYEWMAMNKNIVDSNILFLPKWPHSTCLDWRYMHDISFFSIKQFFKFNFVGILNAIVSYSIFIFCLDYFTYMISLFISHLIGVAHSYVWNRNWTFKKTKSKFNEFLRFNSVYVIVFIVNAISLTILVDALEFDPRIGQLIVLPIISVISFIGHKYWSFNEKHN